MTRFPDLFAALAAPFDAREIKTRPQGKQRLSYVTARTVMNRLDEVVGPENWWDDYEQNEESVVCRLTLRLPDGTTVTKCDAGGHAGMADTGDDEKSAYSDAFKRAAVKFGVGRHLYGDGIPRLRGGRARSPAEVKAAVAAAVAAAAGPQYTIEEAQRLDEAALRQQCDQWIQWADETNALVRERFPRLTPEQRAAATVTMEHVVAELYGGARLTCRVPDTARLDDRIRLATLIAASHDHADWLRRQQRRILDTIARQSAAGGK